MPVKIAITAGEPAGIGPDLILALSQKEWPAILVVFADKQMLQQRAQLMGLSVDLIDYLPTHKQPARKSTLYVVNIEAPLQVIPGQLESGNGHYVVETLRRACQATQTGQFDAIVTGPVNKGIINQAGIPFSGHTEYFAEQANDADVVMMLATEGLRVVLATTHIPVTQISDAITEESLCRVLRVVNQDLKSKFAIAQPHIFVCGLNPHAGEDGHIGREEIEVICPALEKLRVEGMKITGPLSADTIFQPKYMEQADAFLAMFHDQGLPVLKYKGFGASVNITLGLPFVRTSVDHGTALELAGKGSADQGSFVLALEQAITLANNQH